MKVSRNLPAVIVSPVFVNGTTLLRAFGKRGAYCVAVASRPDICGFASRFARETVVLPRIDQTPGVFAEWLLSRSDLYGALVLPTGDDVVAELDAHRETLEDKFHLCMPGRSVCRIALDKGRLAEAAGEAGVPGPRTIPDPVEKTALEAAELGFPAIVKPCYCIGFSRAFSGKAAVVHDGAGLSDLLARCRELAIRVVLQEKLPDQGPVASHSGYVRRSGQIVGDFTTVRPGMFPPRMGTGFLEISKPIKPVLEYGRCMVRSLKLAGTLFNMDFKFDPRDRLWKLLDLNVRSWRQISLAPMVGRDVFEHLLRDYTGAEPLPDAPVRSARWWFCLKDALLLHKAFPKEGPTLGQYLSLVWSRGSFGLLRADDLRPFLHDIKPLLLRRVKRWVPDQ